MSEANALHLVSSLVMFGAALVPIYLSVRLKNNLRILTVLLTIFILVHGIYHVVYYMGHELLADGLFRTISIVVLIIFGISYLHTIKHRMGKIAVR